MSQSSSTLCSVISYQVSTVEATGGLALGQIRPLEQSSNRHRLRHGTSSLEEKWRGESVRGGGGIILALAPAYSPFAAAYFGVLRCSCEFSRERVKWKHSQVSGGLFLALPGSITNTTACLIRPFSAEQRGWVLQRKLSPTNLPV